MLEHDGTVVVRWQIVHIDGTACLTSPSLELVVLGLAFRRVGVRRR